MWHVSVLDIERTLTMATQKVCRDHSVSEAVRKRRMEGIGILAEVPLSLTLPLAPTLP